MQKRGTDYVHSSIGGPEKTFEHEWYKQPTLYARTVILSCAHLEISQVSYRQAKHNASLNSNKLCADRCPQPHHHHPCIMQKVAQ